MLEFSSMVLLAPSLYLCTEKVQKVHSAVKLYEK